MPYLVKIKYFTLISILCLMAIFLFLNFKKEKNDEDFQELKNKETVNDEITIAIPEQDKITPVTDFFGRITKKPFGIYITTKNSPVQPERFSGYHTGVDVEYEDKSGEVEVRSICEGEMVLKRWVSGYGGTAIIKCQKNGIDYYLLYGHLKNESITDKKEIKTGEKIGILGKGETRETDGERKHLHFSIHKNTLDLRGYVQNKDELENWVDPKEEGIF